MHNLQDKITTAFESLEDMGIPTVQGKLCCNDHALEYFHSCGVDKFVYFTQTDIHDYYIDVKYGDVHNAMFVARAIVAALEAEGINVLWDGNARTAIKILATGVKQ